jgi:hypothetical protein
VIKKNFFFRLNRFILIQVDFPDTELKAKIEAFKAERKAAKLAGKTSEVMDMSSG